MIYNILKNYKKNIISIIFLIIGYFIGILSLSVGISIIKDVREYSLDSTSGNTNDIVISYIDFKNLDSNFSNALNNIINDLSNDVEIQVINLNDIYINNNDNYKATIVPTLTNYKSDWHVPILQGNYFSTKDYNSNNNVVILGKDLANELFPNGINSNSKINIIDKTYTVIGVCGRMYRQTQWDSAIYIPFNSYPEILNANFSDKSIENQQENEYSLSLFLRKSKNHNLDLESLVKNTFDEELKNSGYQYSVDFEYIESRDNSSFFNSILGTTLISGMILIIVIINVINLSLFWIFNRKKEICIKKLLGATDFTIIISLILETTIIALFSAILAIIVQFIISKIFLNYLISFGISCNISLSNFIICFCIAIICGFVSSLIPVKEMLKMQPIQALKSE